MAWKETNPKNEKLKFIGDWLKNEFSISDLCRRYNISRKTGYKLINRYEAEGEKSFEEKSHARHTHPNVTSIEIQHCLLAELRAYHITFRSRRATAPGEINDDANDYP